MMVEVAERNLIKVIDMMKKYGMKLLRHVTHYGASMRYQAEYGPRWFNLFFANYECYSLLRSFGM